MSRVAILHLEDSPLDAELVHARLRQGGLAGDVTRVDTRPAFAAALAADPLDLILADYALPGFDGLEALELARARRPDVPFLFVSGQLGEEVAVDTLHRGATDYVLKQRLDRLVPAVRRALAEAQERNRRRHAEAGLRASEERFRTLAEALPQLVWTCGADGMCDYLSRQWSDYTGTAPEAHFGLNWLDAVHPDDRERTRDAWLRGGATGVYDVEYRLRGADGTYRWFKARGLPLRDGGRRILKWFGTSTDIDDQKRAEETLKDNARRKDEFLAMLAHELRNPLNPIRNAVHILRFRGGDARTVDHVRALIDRQVRHLARLVDDLLEVSRLTRGKVELRQERLDLGRVVRLNVDDNRGLLEEAGLAVAVEVPPTPVWIRGDATRLAQVMDNLLQNAAKFTERDGTVAVRLTAPAGADRAEVSVRDSGIGIEPEMLARLFEPFSQADRTLDRSKGGLGLGLALVKGLVELHGGGVRAASAGLGRGAEFTFWLPREQEPAALSGVAPVLPHGSGKRLKVLVVEDNRDSADSLRVLLEMFGYAVAVAYTGTDGLAAAREGKPDVVVCDIGLPGMDGFALASALRQDPGTAGSRLIAVTGYGQEEDRRRALAAGFDQHLVKPVDPEKLLGQIDPVPG